MALKDKAALIQLRVSQWGGEKLDLRVTAEAESREKAARGSLKATKRLIPADMLKPVKKAASKLRHTFYDRTAPWATDHARVVQKGILLKLVGELGDLRDEFNESVEKFIGTYEQYLASGVARQRLGNAYNKEDFPDATQLRIRFNVSFLITPIPDSEAWQLQIPVEEMDKLQSQLDGLVEEAEKQITEYWIEIVGSRAHDALGALLGQGRFYRSLADKLLEITEGVSQGHYDLPDELVEEAKPLHAKAAEIISVLETDRSALKADSLDRASLAADLHRLVVSWDFKVSIQ